MHEGVNVCAVVSTSTNITTLHDASALKKSFLTTKDRSDSGYRMFLRKSSNITELD